MEVTTESVGAREWVLLVFDGRNRLLLRRDRQGQIVEPWSGPDAPGMEQVEALTGEKREPTRLQRITLEGKDVEVFVVVLAEAPPDAAFASLHALEAGTGSGTLAPSERLKGILEAIEPQLHRIPYLDLKDSEYIYRFRTARERNREVYVDAQSDALYQSALCAAVKAIRRKKEKASAEPAMLDFGPVHYLLPSHFGFCLGVQNAIERAYETVATHPGRRVFMLSELIHNPFVNDDLLVRGLRYLQTDKGLPLTETGEVAAGPDDPAALWNRLGEDDIVIIPAFGATNEDKTRLVKRGLAIRENDATCMLVEKVWKAARRYAEAGYTVLIHGKAEHEETKATFSNASSHGPALMLRNRKHAHALGEVILAEGEAKARRFERSFAGLYSEGFDPHKDLEKIAVVNQTTLLRNETLAIIDDLRAVVAQKYGEAQVDEHLWTQGKGDTLCYATQVNQDALQKAIEQPVDAALVVGGRNSSNTFQLYRLCAERFGENAHYIQSEANILSRDEILHYDFPHHGPATPGDRREVVRPFLPPSREPVRILVTGGASCPDGIIQQVIHRINSFFPNGALRPVEAVLQSVEPEA